MAESCGFPHHLIGCRCLDSWGPPLPELEIKNGGLTDTELLDRWQAISDAKEPRGPADPTLREVLREAISQAEVEVKD